jgi:hypothetical protein
MFRSANASHPTGHHPVHLMVAVISLTKEPLLVFRIQKRVRSALHLNTFEITPCFHLTRGELPKIRLLYRRRLA